MNVLLGHSQKDKKKHCSDGDSVYITGSFHNELVRLLGIDAPEVRGLDLDKLENQQGGSSSGTSPPPQHDKGKIPV
ncbi:MAG: hypothetical protein PVF58_16710 [Candidatus Methanofastidiosia archaeon]|jgi:hypothetical protein